MMKNFECSFILMSLITGLGKITMKDKGASVDEAIKSERIFVFMGALGSGAIKQFVGLSIGLRSTRLISYRTRKHERAHTRG